MLHRPVTPTQEAPVPFQEPHLAEDSAANVAETAKRMGLLRDGETVPRMRSPTTGSRSPPPG